MNKQLTLGAVAALLMAGGQANVASADAIVYSTLGPGNTFESGSSLEINARFAWAIPFTPTTNFTLRQIDVAMNRLNVSNPTIMLSLEGTSSGLPNGTPLESFTLGPNLPFWTGAPACNDTSCVIQPSQIVMSTSSVELLAGTEYWLVTSRTPGASGGWGTNNIGATGTRGLSVEGGAFSFSTGTLPAFAVLGTPVGVPERATLGLLVLGLLGAGFAGRKRRG